LDVRVDPADLNLIPPGAALIAAIRPDLPRGFTALLESHGSTLHRLPALQWLGQQLLTQSLATPLGLRSDRAILVALLAETGSFEPLKKVLIALNQRALTPGVGPQIAAALKPARLPETALRIRLVAQLADAEKTRAGVRALVTRARKMGFTGLHLTTAPTAPKPLAGLAAKGVVAVGYGPHSAQSWTLTGGRLLVDVLLPVSGRWSTTRAAKQLTTMLSSPARPATLRPFERGILLSSAELSVVLRGPELALAARWLGVAAGLSALRAVPPQQHPRSLAQAWRIANLPVALQSAGTRPFVASGVRLYLVGARPQLRFSWRLTATGHKLLDATTAAVAGRDLALDNGLVERWLKPLAVRVDMALPPVGPFSQPGLNKKLAEGGFFMWPLALAEFWPRLLPMKPVRKRVLKFLRTQVRPERFVRRVNVRRQGKLLELVLEGRLPPPPKGR